MYEGYHCEPTPEGVGLATTRTVVTSSVMVLLLNYLLTAAFLTKILIGTPMKNSRSLEIGTGLFVLLGFAALAFLTTQLPGTSLKFGGSDGGYTVTAKFDNIGDLKPGSPVTMAGVRVGRVESIRFDPKDFKAAVVLRIEDQY